MKHCKSCEHESEEFRCPDCGMTGPEIAEQRELDSKAVSC